MRLPASASDPRCTSPARRLVGTEELSRGAWLRCRKGLTALLFAVTTVGGVSIGLGGDVVSPVATDLASSPTSAITTNAAFPAATATTAR